MASLESLCTVSYSHFVATAAVFSRLWDIQGAQTWITQLTPCLPLAFIRVHQMAPPRTVVTTSSCSLLLIYRLRKDERLSWPSWLTYSRRFTHISDHPSAVGRAQDSESSPVKDQRSTAEPRNQQRMAWPWKLGKELFKVIEHGAVR